MGSGHRNIYGRKGGRGLRPFLLIPKVLAVATFFGALVVATVIVWTVEPRGGQQWDHVGRTVSMIFRRVAVPALVAAIVFGLLLWLQHPRALIGMRWLQVKLILLAVALPLLHWYNSDRVAQLVAYESDGAVTGPPDVLWQVRWGMLVSIVVMTAVVILGRHKPRLQQKVRTSADQRATQGDADDSAS